MLKSMLLLIPKRSKVRTAPDSIVLAIDLIIPAKVLSPGHKQKMEFIVIISIP